MNQDRNIAQTATRNDSHAATGDRPRSGHSHVAPQIQCGTVEQLPEAGVQPYDESTGLMPGVYDNGSGSTVEHKSAAGILDILKIFNAQKNSAIAAAQ